MKHLATIILSSKDSVQQPGVFPFRTSIPSPMTVTHQQLYKRHTTKTAYGSYYPTIEPIKGQAVDLTHGQITKWTIRGTF